MTERVTLTATVWVDATQGKVERNAIIQAGLDAVRDDIGTVFNLTAELQTEPLPEVRYVDEVKGRDYTVLVSFDVTGDNPADIAAHLKSLDSPVFIPSSDTDG